MAYLRRPLLFVLLIGLIPSAFTSSAYAGKKKIFIPKAALEAELKYSEMEAIEASKAYAFDVVEKYLMKQYLYDHKLMTPEQENKDCIDFALRLAFEMREQAADRIDVDKKVAELSDAELKKYYEEYYPSLHYKSCYCAVHEEKHPFPHSDPPPLMPELYYEVRDFLRQEWFHEKRGKRKNEEAFLALNAESLEALKKDEHYGASYERCLCSAGFARDLFEKIMDTQAAKEISLMTDEQKEDYYVKHAKLLGRFGYKIPFQDVLIPFTEVNQDKNKEHLQKILARIRGEELFDETILQLKKTYIIKSDSKYILDAARSRNVRSRYLD